MARLCDCPGESVYEKGKVRVEAKAGTEAAAMAAMEAKLPKAKTDAEAALDAAHGAAIAVGDAACKPEFPPCKAVFRKEIEGPWKAVGALDPYTDWLARGGYNWKVIVECEVPPVAVAVKDEAGSQQQLKT